MQTRHFRYVSQSVRRAPDRDSAIVRSHGPSLSVSRNLFRSKFSFIFFFYVGIA